MTAPDATPRRCPICHASFIPLFEQEDRLHHIPGRWTVVECAGCRLVSHEPFPRPHELARLYPDDYYAYLTPAAPARPGGIAQRLRHWLDEVHLDLRRPPWPLRLLVWPLLLHKSIYGYARHLRHLPRGRLLDVGCGDGAFLLKARRMGFAVEGLEPGAPPNHALDAAGIALHRVTLAELADRDGAFDVITLNHVFEHLPDPEAALARLRGLLGPAGRLLVRMPRTDHFLWRRWRGHWFGLELPRHLYLYNPANFTCLARRCGLRVTSIESEMLPVHLQWTLKSRLFGRRFDTPHWLDHPLVGWALTPVCAILKRLGHADAMAVWLTPDH